MGLFKAIILGIVQGLTEFLPVSSSGHLTICKQLIGMEDIGFSFDIILHVGTLLAVFLVYWRDIGRLIVDGIGIIVDVCFNIKEFFVSKKMQDDQSKVCPILPSYIPLHKTGFLQVLSLRPVLPAHFSVVS